MEFSVIISDAHLNKFSPFCSSHAILNPAVLHTEVCMQNRSGFQSGCIIFAPSLQSFKVGASLTSENADKRRELNSVCCDPVIDSMVLFAYL
jgi:hypothetical protein